MAGADRQFGLICGATPRIARLIMHALGVASCIAARRKPVVAGRRGDATRSTIIKDAS